MRSISLVIAASLILAAGATVAAPARPDDGRAVGDLLRCRAEGDDTRRLACFDRAASALATSVERRDVVVLDRAQVQETRRSLFGFSLPRLPLLGDQKDDRALARIEDSIAAARTDGDGNWLVTLRGGGTWAQTDGQPIARAPRAGDAVVINRGTLGSYFMRVAGQPGVKVRRQN